MHYAFRFLIFFVLHPPVLKPDLYLALGEIEQIGHLHSSGTAQVAIEMKLLLQFN